MDFPFALPTAVAGLTLANLFSAKGWLGQYLVPLGVKGASLQNPLRDSAFVDLVHAVVNSNDFAYRF